MYVTPVYLPTSCGIKKRYLLHGWCGNVFVSVVGHTHMFVINKAIRHITGT